MADPSSVRETGKFRSDDMTTSRTVSKTTSSIVVRSYLYLNVTDVIDTYDVIYGTPLPTESPSIDDVNWNGYSLIAQLPGYSPWVGIRTAAVLGGILALLVAYLCIKAHFPGRWLKRHSIHSLLMTSPISGAHMGAATDVIDSSRDIIDIQPMLEPESRVEILRGAALELELVVDEAASRSMPTPPGESFCGSQDNGGVNPCTGDYVVSPW